MTHSTKGLGFLYKMSLHLQPWLVTRVFGMIETWHCGFMAGMMEALSAVCSSCGDLTPKHFVGTLFPTVVQQEGHIILPYGTP